MIMIRMEIGGGDMIAGKSTKLPKNGGGRGRREGGA